jgi:predicted short-subunit dehydrogenase-like oxidoreductase (DUF2520 family)
VLVAAGLTGPDSHRLLVPLALQSIHNATLGDKVSLTGPIVRGDKAVLQSHRAALQQLGLKKTLSVYTVMEQRARELFGLKGCK